MSDAGEEWGDWRGFIQDTDAATARAIVEALQNSTPAANGSLTADGALAQQLFMRELQQIRADLPSREAGEELEGDENELEEAREAAVGFLRVTIAWCPY